MRHWSAVLVLVGGLLVVGPSLAAAQQPAPAAGSASSVRIAYIDVQRVLARSSAGVAAREQLEREKGGMQKEMDGKRPLMTADARREKQETFERKRRDAARMMDDYQKELEKKEQILLQKVLQELSGIIEKVGKDKGFYMIVEKRGASVLYASPDADLTDEVINAYNQAVPAKKTP